jgi:hypothetical protein
MNGAASDLRTGLPKQMTEIHEPVRLHLVVEASVETLLMIVERQPALAELVKNEWIRVASLDPKTRRIHTFDARTGFRPYHPSAPDIPVVARSADWYAGHDGFLAPARIHPWHLFPPGPCCLTSSPTSSPSPCCGPPSAASSCACACSAGPRRPSAWSPASPRPSSGSASPAPSPA